MRQRSVLLTFGPAAASLAAGYGVLFTMLDDYRDEYGIAEGALGLIVGIGFVAGFVAQVLIGPYADRGHARRLALTGLGLNLVGLLVMAFATAFVPLVAGRLVMGVGLGTAMPAIRRIVIVSEPDRLGHNLGRLLSIEVAGFAFGPVVSAVLVGPFGIPAPFLAIAVFTVLLMAVVGRTHVAESPSGGEARAQRFAFDLLRQRAFAGAVTLGCGTWLMIGAFDALWSVNMSDLEASRWMANLGVTLFALPLIAFAAVGGRMAQRVGPFRVSTAGLVAGAMFMFLYGQIPAAGLLFAFAMVHGVSDGLTMASTPTAVGMVVPAARQAGAQGVLGGFQTLVAGLSASLAGVLYEVHGRAVAYGAAAAMMLVLTAAGLLLAGPARSTTGTGRPARQGPSPIVVEPSVTDPRTAGPGVVEPTMVDPGTITADRSAADADAARCPP